MIVYIVIVAVGYVTGAYARGAVHRRKIAQATPSPVAKQPQAANLAAKQSQKRKRS
ncbi:hypothetical protein [Methylocystis rosea]|uniref:hypothetical protein n=1 Tax=Methylocystis rosea TaxID=173366 RepID=UPI001FEF9E0D|nr:hypothetical protein [Methylocystis rosea]